MELTEATSKIFEKAEKCNLNAESVQKLSAEVFTKLDVIQNQLD